MGMALLIFALWCLPSAALVLCIGWQRRRARARIRALHLDELFEHA